MNIAVVGIGYVGLVSAACFAELGAKVYCIDTDIEKINALRAGKIPIYEPGLDRLVAHNSEAGRLHFCTELNECLSDVQIVFIAVGTPSDRDGAADMQYVFQVAESIGQHMQNELLVVSKSTVPIGSSYKVREIIEAQLKDRGVKIRFDVASNPEFLKEGNAIDDFMKPDRVVVGAESDWARDLLTRLYKPMLLNKFRVLFMDIPSAEMTKYAANAMLATRISFMNDIANLCELVGADVNMVRRGIGSDSRIGSKFLYAGCGYGGSCFPKDVKALIHIGEKAGYKMQILEAVESVNEKQKSVLFDKLYNYYNGDLAGKHIAIWGLAFKPGTDDIREAPSLSIIEQLLDAGCTVAAYDPAAMDETKHIFGDRIRYASDLYDAVLDADAIMHVTEWKEFRMPTWELIRRAMKTPLLIDGRNVFEFPSDAGFTILSVGTQQD